MKTLPFVLLFLAASSSWAGTVQFSELGTSSLFDVNGLHINGVQFAFAPGQAIFNQQIGTAGTSVLSVDPVLSGPTTGILSFQFDQPTQFLSFDILLLSIATIDDSNLGVNGGPAYTVLLSNGTTLDRGTAPQPGGVYSEDHFFYTGSPIDGATVSFFNGADSFGTTVSQFGLDNLTFGTPEPATFALLGAGLLLMGQLKFRR
jgi:hypothetical protein